MCGVVAEQYAELKYFEITLLYALLHWCSSAKSGFGFENF